MFRGSSHVSFSGVGPFGSESGLRELRLQNRPNENEAVKTALALHRPHEELLLVCQRPDPGLKIQITFSSFRISEKIIPMFRLWYVWTTTSTRIVDDLTYCLQLFFSREAFFVDSILQPKSETNPPFTSIYTTKDSPITLIPPVSTSFSLSSTLLISDKKKKLWTLNCLPDFRYRRDEMDNSSIQVSLVDAWTVPLSHAYPHPYARSTFCIIIYFAPMRRYIFSFSPLFIIHSIFASYNFASIA